MAFGFDDAAGIIGMGAGIYNMFRNKDADDRRQIEQQQKLTNMQADANEAAADRNQQRALEMWNATNFGAQKEHMIKAGLNPAMMYGMKGGGGVTTGSPNESGVGQGQAANAAATESNKIAMGMQLAQMGLMTAQAEKTKAETKKIEGVDTELGKTQMEKVSAETKMANIQAEIAGMTQSDAIKTISETATKAVAEAAQAVQKQIITEETMEAQIETIKTQAIGAMIENEAKRAGINLTEARIKEIATNIEQRWRGQEIDVENNKRMTEAMLWGAGIHAAGSLVNGIVNVAGKGVPNVVKHIK